MPLCIGEVKGPRLHDAEAQQCECAEIAVDASVSVRVGRQWIRQEPHLLDDVREVAASGRDLKFQHCDRDS